MNAKPIHRDPPKSAKASRPRAATNEDSSKPIDATTWKAKSTVLAMPKDAVQPKPLTDDDPPVTTETSSRPITATRWKADHETPPTPTEGARPKARGRPARTTRAKNEASSQPITATRWKAEHDVPPRPKYGATPKPSNHQRKPARAKNEASSKPVTATRWKTDRDARVEKTSATLAKARAATKPSGKAKTRQG